MAKGKTDLEIKNTQALQLRVAGFSFEQIANQLNYANASGAYKAVKKALSKIRLEAGETYVNLETARLDRLQASVWAKATGAQPDMKAVEKVLQITDRRMRLYGITGSGSGLSVNQQVVVAPRAGQESEKTPQNAYADWTDPVPLASAAAYLDAEYEDLTEEENAAKP